MSAATPSTSTSTSPSPTLDQSRIRGVFVGSGSDGMSDPRIAETILGMLPRNKQQQPATVLYLGTATYDLPQFQTRQTQWFQQMGCRVVSLNLVDHLPSLTDIESTIHAADIVVVGGGNTLFALDRWHCLGVVEPLKRRAVTGDLIVTGGSAGAICWFDGGHSDSMDPDTYKVALQGKFGGNTNSGLAANDNNTNTKEQAVDVVDESQTTTNNASSSSSSSWKYIRVSGLGLLPGLTCPHHDRIQSNGVLRAHDFDQMLLTRHSGEVGIGMDHWAALVVDGPNYRVVSLDGKPGSVGNNGHEFCTDGTGKPGIWIKQVSEDGTRVSSTVCPSQGKIQDILREPLEIVEDIDDMERCRLANPDDGPVP